MLLQYSAIVCHLFWLNWVLYVIFLHFLSPLCGIADSLFRFSSTSAPRGLFIRRLTVHSATGYVSLCSWSHPRSCAMTRTRTSRGGSWHKEFSWREINQMEQEMCSYLECELTVDTTTLKNFETMVRKDFKGQGPYPTYIMSMFSYKKLESSPPISSANPFTKLKYKLHSCVWQH